jgi:siroheme synthase-like protein
LSGRRCVVVGSGAETVVRARLLLDAGAVLTVLSTSPSDELVTLLGEHPEASLLQRGFEDTDLDGVWLVVLSDMNAALAERLYESTTARQILFCAVDQPAYCTFSHLALARSGDVTVAISTNGKAPALARRLREEFERLFAESNLTAFVEWLTELREKTPSAERRAVLGEAVKRLRFVGKWEIADE